MIVTDIHLSYHVFGAHMIWKMIALFYHIICLVYTWYWW